MESGKEIPEFLLENDEIDRMIEERAGAFNLTGTNIRNILYVSYILPGFTQRIYTWTILNPHSSFLVFLEIDIFYSSN